MSYYFGTKLVVASACSSSMDHIKIHHLQLCCSSSELLSLQAYLFAIYSHSVRQALADLFAFTAVVIRHQYPLLECILEVRILDSTLMIACIETSITLTNINLDM